MDVKKLARIIDLSCVQANSSVEEIKEAAQFAIQYNCICTFALPAHTPLLLELVKNHPAVLVQEKDLFWRYFERNTGF